MTSILKQPQKATVSSNPYGYSKATTNIPSFADLSSFEVSQEVRRDFRSECRQTCSLDTPKNGSNLPRNQVYPADTLLPASELHQRGRNCTKNDRSVLAGVVSASFSVIRPSRGQSNHSAGLSSGLEQGKQKAPALLELGPIGRTGVSGLSRTIRRSGLSWVNNPGSDRP